MALKAIIHIGPPKTGTTAIQLAMLASTKALREAGILYPKPRSHGKNHKILLQGLVAEEDMPRTMRQRFTPEVRQPQRQAFLDDIRSALARHPYRALLLSSEALFEAFPEGELERLRGELEALGVTSFDIVSYPRRPSEKYLSSIQQHIKASRKVIQPRFPPYRPVLERYVQVFGAENVHVRTFDRKSLADGNIVTDFYQHYLAPFGLKREDIVDPGPKNETMSAEAMDIVRQYRADFHAERENRFTRDTGKLRGALSAIEDRIGPSRPRLKPGIAELADYCNGDALWLRDQFGVVFAGYDYDRVERGEFCQFDRSTGRFKLPDLVVIDRDRQREMIAQLAKTSWASGGMGGTPRFLRWLIRGKRRVWIDKLAERLVAN